MRQRRVRFAGMRWQSARGARAENFTSSTSAAQKITAVPWATRNMPSGMSRNGTVTLLSARAHMLMTAK